MISILPIGGSLFYLLEYLYDMGYRRGDFIIIASFNEQSIFQLTLIALSFTVRRSISLLHSSVFVTLLLALIVVVIFTRPHNYMRFNLWSIVVIMFNVWLAFMTTIRDVMPNASPIALWIFLFLGWLVIAAMALLLQYKKQKTTFPTLIHTQDSEFLEEQIKFMFRSTSRKEIRRIFTQKTSK